MNNEQDLDNSNIDGINQSFSVYAYTIKTEDMPRWGHWSEGLNMVIEKNGVEIKLNGEELKQVVASLPRTFGGSY